MLNNKNKKILFFLSVGFLVVPIFAFAQIGMVPQITGLGDLKLEELVGNIIELFLAFLGLIALLIILYAGFIWMTSGGSEEKISKAKGIMKAGIIGLIIIVCSYAIANFLMRSLIDVTEPDPPVVGCTVGSCYGCEYIYGSDCNPEYSPGSCSNLCNPDDGLDRLSVDWRSPKGNNVSLCSMIQVDFRSSTNNEPIIIDSSVNSTNFKLYRCTNSTCDINNREDVTGQGHFVLSGDVVQFLLDSDLLPNSKYLVYLMSNGIKDSDDNYLLSDYFWNFNTGTESDNTPPKVTNVFPVNGTEEVCRNSYIKVQFSEDMDVSSMKNLESFQLYERAINSESSFIESNIEFIHKTPYSDKLILKPNSNYQQNYNYAPILNANILKDTCGNNLDGDEDGISENSPIDNYPPNNTYNLWNFSTGQTIECEPAITSSNLQSYYDGAEQVLTINGNYLDDSVAVFNREVIINSNNDDDGLNFCMSVSDGVINQFCSQPDWWSSEQIKLKVPAKSGNSNGARTGEIQIQTPYGDVSTDFTLLSPRIERISPDFGGNGQFITINGINFGDTQGDSMVYFRDDAGNNIPANLPCSNNSWRDNRIIISAPENLSVGLYDIQVKIVDGVENHWSNMAEFELNDSEAGPGLCSINPSDLEFETLFTLNGIRFGTPSDSRKVVMGNDYNYIEATNHQWSELVDGQDTIVSAKTPNLSSGNVGVRIVVGEGQNAKYSNYLSANILSSQNQILNISYISPTSGPVGSYVNIYGNGFGNLRAGSMVKFKKGNEWIDGNFDFPEECSTNFWGNNKIIVKVPVELQNTTGSSIKVQLENQEQSNSVQFTVNTNALAPSLCAILPDSGVLNDQIDIFGEYFTNISSVKFNYLGNNIGDNATTFDVQTENNIEVTVPQTQTGPVAVSNSSGYGNSLNFTYGSGGGDDQANESYYEWGFRTCTNCKIPRVRRLACSPSGSSPSPFPGDSNVPIDANLYIEFEYLDGSDVEIEEETLNTDNIKFFKCSSNAVCEDQISITISPAEHSLIINYANDLIPGTIYKVFLSNNISDVEGSTMTDDDFWFFTTNPNGGECVGDKLRVRLNDEDNKTVFYEADQSIKGTTQVWDTHGCYLCDNNYPYSWSKDDNNYFTYWDVNSGGTASTTIVKINNSLHFGELNITATNNVLMLSDSAHLKIIQNCAVFNNNQDGCIANECCWNASDSNCENENSNICNNPFVKHKACVTSGNDIILGSPSPKYNAQYRTPIDAHIFAKFAKSGFSNVSMATSTYAGGVQIEDCGNEETASNICSDVTSSLIPVVSLSSNSEVNYSLTHVFAPNTWYKATLKSSIKDIFNKSLQEEDWLFRTGTSNCTPTHISVDPDSEDVGFNITTEYVTSCIDDNCNVCDNNYTYNWSVENTEIASLLNPSILPNANVKSHTTEGQTKVFAINTENNLSDFGILKVTHNPLNPPDDNYCLQINNEDACVANNCCWDGSNCSNPPCTIPDFKVIDSYPEEEQGVCPNTAINFVFNGIVDQETLANNIIIIDDGDNIFNKFLYNTYLNENGHSVLNLYLLAMLETNKEYSVILKSGIKSRLGSDLYCDSVSNDSDYCHINKFKVRNSVCNLDHINVVDPENKYFEFNLVDQLETFRVEGVSPDGDIIQPINNFYDWQWMWSTPQLDTAIVSLTPPINENIVGVKSANHNGNTTVKIKALKLDPAVGYNGPILSDEVNVRVFMCENPWSDSITDNNYNFSLMYCRDRNPSLFPELKSVMTFDNPEGVNGLLREYILTYLPDASSKTAFLNDKIYKSSDIKLSDLTSGSFILKLFSKVFGTFINNILGAHVLAVTNDYEQDVIGVRIYKNDMHLSASDWYHESGYVPFGGSPGSAIVDSYGAVKEGTTIYVNAGNKSDDLMGSLNTKVYLISYNSNASEITRSIVNQLVENWKFNINLSGDSKILLVEDVKKWEIIRRVEKIFDNYAENNKHCAYERDPENGLCPHIGDIYYTLLGDKCYGVSKDIMCSDDSQCQNHEMEFDKCVSVYPELRSGTYKKGISISTWPSWIQTLSQQLGQNLPLDPVNKMGVCANYDPITCWNAINSTFTCPSGSHIFYYKTINSIDENLSALKFDFYSLFNYSSVEDWSGYNGFSNLNNSLHIDNGEVCNDTPFNGCTQNEECAGECKECTNGECVSMCSADMPFCINGNTCVACLEDNDCPGEYDECNNGVCLSKCGGSTPVFDQTTQQCVACVNNDSCLEPCTNCNITTHTCEYNCESGETCLNDFCVITCNSNDDCPDKEYCQFNGNCNLNYFGQYIDNCNPSPDSWPKICAPALNCRDYVNNTLSDVLKIQVFKKTPTCNAIIQSGCLNEIPGFRIWSLTDYKSGSPMEIGNTLEVIFGHIPSNSGFINLQTGCLYNFELSVSGYQPFGISKTRFSPPWGLNNSYRIYLEPEI